MTATDVANFYQALGIQLPQQASRNVTVHCFAHPDAHQNGDRNPSCSVNLITGAWNCHGCGAHGGAYDAAIATGHTPRSAMQLLTEHELAEPRRRLSPAERSREKLLPPVEIGRTDGARLAADESDVCRWAEALDANNRLLRRLILERGWSTRVLRDLGVGFDGSRITIPVRSQQNVLRGVLRYDPFGLRGPKMLAIQGTKLGLIPHPRLVRSERIVLVEGPPDMIAARSCGLAAIAVPGTNTWQPSWASLLVGKHVTIVMDCDPPGRHAADRIARSLNALATANEVVDLCQDRHDGYDLTDRILERRRARVRPSVPSTSASLLRPTRHLSATTPHLVAGHEALDARG